MPIKADTKDGQRFAEMYRLQNEEHKWPHEMPRGLMELFYAQAQFNGWGHNEDDLGTLHGQPCYLRVYKAEVAKAHMDKWEKEPGSGDVAPDGPNVTEIDLVIAEVLSACIQFTTSIEMPDTELFEYDGLRVGAGWILGMLYVAKAHGATNATVGIKTNDGNLECTAWCKEKDVLVYAYHDTYYGS